MLFLNYYNLIIYIFENKNNEVAKEAETEWRFDVAAIQNLWRVVVSKKKNEKNLSSL